jgi:hypothetical protein
MVVETPSYDLWMARNLTKCHKIGIIYLRLLRHFTFGRFARHPDVIER